MKTINFKYSSQSNLKDFIIKNNILNEKNILLQIFSGVFDFNFIENLVLDIKKMIPHVKIIGSTTSGEILDGLAQEKSVVLSFSIFEDTKIITYYSDIKNNANKTAQDIINQFNNISANVAISFVDMSIDGKEYVDTFKEYDENLIIAGGLAGDNAKFVSSIIFTEKKILRKGAVVALLINKKLKVVTNASFGWEQVGKTMTITKANKNVVYEIDGMNIIELYKKYLGEDAIKKFVDIAMEFPLIIKKYGINIPRAVLAKNGDSLIFAGSLSVGDKVTFSYGNIQSILNYNRKLENNLEIQNSESIFVYSCAARLRILEENVNIELSPLNNICNVSGFFTYGEFYSDIKLKNNELLNQTMTILALSENNSFYNVKDIVRKTMKASKREIVLKALSHLASQTSIELEDTNKFLQERVKAEVEKNRIKDKAMLQQSKLAQMGEMIGAIAHQWRQPLTSLSINLQNLIYDYEDNLIDENYLKNYISDNLKTIFFMSKTIDDFRNFFEIDKEKTCFNIRDSISETLIILKDQFKHHEISVELLGNNFEINSFKSEFQQVILNIINNAKDALKGNKIKDKKIKIILRDKKIIIQDNAGGIPNHIIERVFEPYFTTKDQGKGIGIGLYMSKIIIETHMNGKLSVKNIDKGASFIIEFL